MADGKKKNGKHTAKYILIIAAAGFFLFSALFRFSVFSETPAPEPVQTTSAADNTPAEETPAEETLPQSKRRDKNRPARQSLRRWPQSRLRTYRPSRRPRQRQCRSPSPQRRLRRRRQRSRLPQNRRQPRSCSIYMILQYPL